MVNLEAVSVQRYRITAVEQIIAIILFLPHFSNHATSFAVYNHATSLFRICGEPLCSGFYAVAGGGSELLIKVFSEPG
jgi:hypothetical protein